MHQPSLWILPGVSVYYSTGFTARRAKIAFFAPWAIGKALKFLRHPLSRNVQTAGSPGAKGFRYVFSEVFDLKPTSGLYNGRRSPGFTGVYRGLPVGASKIRADSGWSLPRRGCRTQPGVSRWKFANSTSCTNLCTAFAHMALRATCSLGNQSRSLSSGFNIGARSLVLKVR
jgi:hypothetical protein